MPWLLVDSHAAGVCLVIGTRLDVFPAADLPRRARGGGAHLIEVNPLPVLVGDDRTLSLHLPADLAVPALLDGLEPNDMHAKPAA